MQLFDQNQIPERTWSDIVSLPANSIVNPRIIGGDIVGSSIAIGSGNTIFKADENGIYLGNTTFASAPFRVSMSGSAVATDLTLTGGTIKYGKTTFADTTNAGYYVSSDGFYFGSASDASYVKYNIGTSAFDVKASITTNAGSSIGTGYLDGLVGLSNTNVAAQGWTSTLVFVATDYNTVSWSAGGTETLTTAGGTTYTFASGNTGNMTLTTYIYLDIAVSTTALQTTTTSTTAIGSGKVLVAVATPNTDTTSDATFQVFGGKGGQTLLVDNIAANSASTNEFVSNTAQIANAIITSAKIGLLEVKEANIDTMTASKLTAGTITSKAITLAVADGTGDTYIAAGKTDFTNTDSGFILGIDDSDSDKSKFYIGNSTNYFNFNGTNVSFRTTLADAIIIDSGSNISLRDGGNITFSPLTAPTACTATLVTTGTGNVDNGTHTYKITYVNASGETNLGSASNTVTVDGTHKQVDLSGIPLSTSTSVTARKIYRTKAGGTDYYFLATISNNLDSTYTDNIADASLGTDIYNNKVNDSFGRIYVGTDKVLTVTSSNVFLGVDAGDVNTVGWDNIFIGRAAGQSNTSADYNTFIGAESGLSNTGGYGNTFVGKLSGYGNTDGYYNTRIGYKAGYLSDTEVSCVHLGAFAGYNNNLSNTLFIDNQDRGSASNDRANALVYGTFNSTASSQQITFNVGNLNLLDGVIISTATSTTGIKIGSATTQKLGFYGVAPVDQPATVADATDAASVILRCNDIIDRLQELGLIA